MIAENPILNKYRIRDGRMASPDNFGMTGAFKIPVTNSRHLIVISSGADEEWEHVSIHARERKGKKTKQDTPTWKEMCMIKDIFWGDDECVIQYHPEKKDYVNVHDHVLHLWKPVKQELPKPPKTYV